MTADELLANINNRGALPPTQNVWTSTLILSAADEEIYSTVMPSLLGANQDFFTDYEDSPFVGSQAAYALPKRAAGATIRVAKYVDNVGNEGAPLAQVEVADIGRYNITTANAPIGFYFNSSFVNVLPTPATGTTGSLRLYYTRRPGKLVQDTVNGSSQHTQVATVSSVSVNSGNTTITCTANHSGFAAGATIDVTSYTSPYTLKWKDVTVTTMTAGTATIVCNGVDMTTGINTVVAGDFVTASLNSYVPQGIPVEWHSLIELRVVARVLDSLGDMMGSNSILARSMEMEQRLLALVQPRASGNPKKLNAWR